MDEEEHAPALPPVEPMLVQAAEPPAVVPIGGINPIDVVAIIEAASAPEPALPPLDVPPPPSTEVPLIDRRVSFNEELVHFTYPRAEDKVRLDHHRSPSPSYTPAFPVK
jgi:hypothetical protein